MVITMNSRVVAHCNWSQKLLAAIDAMQDERYTTFKLP